MALITFAQWLKESSPTTRLKQDIALGLRPLAGMGSLDGHSTPPPGIRDRIIKKMKKKKKKKHESVEMLESKTNPVRHTEIDNFLKKIADLKKDVDTIKANSKKQKPEDKKIKPSDEKKKPEDDKDDDADAEGDETETDPKVKSPVQKDKKPVEPVEKKPFNRYIAEPKKKPDVRDNKNGRE